MRDAARLRSEPPMLDDLRALPTVEAVLRAVIEQRPDLTHDAAREGARDAIDAARAGLRAGGGDATLQAIVEAAVGRSRAVAASLRPVINATGVILHTNLGRAPLSDRAIAAMAEVARGYSNLEYDLDKGERGSRHDHARALLRRVTGAEDAIVVNNNAAAVFAALSVCAGAHSERRGVIVSRGQAVEIGGGFRIPDVIAQSGAHIVEVGTTNRTYARDYEAAIDAGTAAILRVHRSNFRIVGFTTEPTVEALATLAHARGLLLIDDLGSGALAPTERFGLAHEPTVQESLAAGADLVLFSGDKLLGGPQCGIVVGRAGLVERLRRHPLARVLRVDKITLAGLEATLDAYARDAHLEEIPVWRMLAAPLDRQRTRAQAWVEVAGAGVVASARTMVGGGSLPEEGVLSWAASIPCGDGATRAAAALRRGAPAIVARVERGNLVLDPRTVDERDDAAVAAALPSALAAARG